MWTQNYFPETEKLQGKTGGSLDNRPGSSPSIQVTYMNASRKHWNRGLLLHIIILHTANTVVRLADI